MNSRKNIFSDEYFDDRNMTDKRRLESYSYELEWLKLNGVKLQGRLCDVGCSTGEFEEVIKWEGEVFGMEVNGEAIKLAKERGIDFNKNILNSEDFFDLVIFRGTIQHVDQPFLFIQKALSSLKVGGFLTILATPNIESTYYRIFNDLPALEKKKCYFLPGFQHVTELCIRNGFELISTDFPYKNSGYDNLLVDMLKFFSRLFLRSGTLSAPFPGNMMNLLFRRLK